jgi:hypothetical protein
MFRGYWGIVVAIAGWLAFVGFISWNYQAPEHPAASKQQQAQTKSGQAVPAAAAMPAEPSKPIEPPEYYQPCGKHGSEGNSDLCAQWSAAKAASQAARWAWWQLWLSTLGVIGLGVTLWFNFRALGIAERSERETQDALVIARDNADAAMSLAKTSKDTAERQLRPYLTLESINIAPDQVAGSWKANAVLVNRGVTPAFDVRIIMISVGRQNDNLKVDIPDEWENCSQATVGPQATLNMSISMDAITPQIHEAILAKKFEIFGIM